MHLTLLGPLGVHDGARAVAISSPKGRLLLATLLLNPGRTVSCASLRTVLWGDEQPRTANAALHNHVLRLRKALGPLAGARLRFDPPGYVFDVRDGELDSQEFAARVGLARAAHLAEDWTAVAAETSAALRLRRGRPLCDIPGLGGVPEVVRLEDLHLQALEWHYDAELHAGRYDGLASELATLAAEHPFREAFHRQLMLVLHHTDRTAEALVAYQNLRTTLVEELGIDPGPAIRGAHQRILAAEHGEPGAVDPGSGGTGAGGSGARREDDATVPLPPAPSQLPYDITDFTGRRRELAALRRVVAGPGGSGLRLVAISGMGGIGKTALALHAAHRLGEEFPDGRIYVDLRGFGSGDPRTAEEVLARLLLDLGARTPLPTHVDDLAALYRSMLAGRRALLVLDNARDTDQVIPLVPGTGGCAAIVTSRHALGGLTGATRIALDPLEDDGRRLLAGLCGPERLATDPEAAARILAACAGLPLAIRIAGARLAGRPEWPLSTLARRLGAAGRLHYLTLDNLTVRGVIAMSHRALTSSGNPAERAAAQAFRQLGLWPAHPLSAEAASALLGLGSDETADLLDVLVDAHLVQACGGGYFRFHDLVGEYAAELASTELTARERTVALTRLQAWYAAASHLVLTLTSLSHAPVSAPSTAAPLPALGTGAEALAWVERELPALCSAARQADACPRPDLAWRIAVGLLGYCHASWWDGRLMGLLTGALDSAHGHGDTEGRGRMLNLLGAVHGMADRYGECLEYLQQAHDLFLELGQDRARVKAMANIAQAYQLMGDVARASDAIADCLELIHELGDPLDCGTLHVLGGIQLAGGEAERAEESYRRVLGMCRSAGNDGYAAFALINLGDTLRVLGRRREALQALNEGLAISRRLGYQATTADALDVTARTHAHFGAVEQARHHWRQALELARELSISKIIRRCEDGLADLDAVGAARSARRARSAWSDGGAGRAGAAPLRA
ncbi:AfsR/SARP family transcriptional regulator [Streptomyces sp. NPDC093225]|uniref:AfsR/SARP family transcriptional regulator n=1 Tax=Streptomyces sp. NPDC093225 TaxID=3366034 RepID=UPI0037FCDBF3